jgi:predicted SAM-dependent methyltransferase
MQPRRRPPPFHSVELLPAQAPFAAALIDELGLRGIHCGTARKFHEGWMNTDILPMPDRDGGRTEPGRIARISRTGDDRFYYLQHDSVEPYPFEDGSFEWAFAEHFLEHLTPEEAVGWLQDLHRLVKPGGIVRLTTPNLRSYVEGYLDPEGRFFAEHRERLGRLRAFTEQGVPARRAWMVNQIFHMWDHKWIYDLDEVRYVAERAGFPPDAIVERSFQDGAVAEVSRLDLPMRSDESLYVELTRPG